MRTIPSILCVGVLTCLLGMGCDAISPNQKKKTGAAAAPGSGERVRPAVGQNDQLPPMSSAEGKQASDSQDQAGKPVPPKTGQGKKKMVNNNVWLETLPDMKRLVLVEAKVCLREGMLEHLLCRNMTKEHESILQADVDAFFIHAALLGAGAEPGNPVKFDPYKPATGTTIKVWVQYKDKNGQEVIHPAQQWIRQTQTKKPLHYDWVFAGSWLEKDPQDPNKKPFYMANAGDVICVANFSASLLDLPVPTEKDVLDLDFEAITERIPPENTPVMVILEPVLKK